jgi:hypothetical protein
MKRNKKGKRLKKMLSEVPLSPVGKNSQKIPGQMQRLTPVILATQAAENGRSVV